MVFAVFHQQDACSDGEQEAPLQESHTPLRSTTTTARHHLICEVQSPTIDYRLSTKLLSTLLQAAQKKGSQRRDAGNPNAEKRYFVRSTDNWYLSDSHPSSASRHH